MGARLQSRTAKEADVRQVFHDLTCLTVAASRMRMRSTRRGGAEISTVRGFVGGAIGLATIAALAAVWNAAASANEPPVARLGWVVYQSGNDNSLYISRLDGNQRRRLTHADYPGGDYEPAFSPNGETIAFGRCLNSEQSYSPCGVWLVLRKGGTAHRVVAWKGLSPDADADDVGGITWSPDGRWIIFAREGSAAEGHSALYAVHPDGTALQRLVYSSLTDRFGSTESPSFSPDGKAIIYKVAETISGPRACDHSRKAPVTSEIQEIVLSTGLQIQTIKPLTPGPPCEFTPRLSRDGTRIAFLEHPTATFINSIAGQLAVLDLRHKTVTRFASGANADNPVWSPDGRWIAYGAYQGSGKSAIYVVRATGGTPVRIPGSEHIDTGPGWDWAA